MSSLGAKRAACSALRARMKEGISIPEAGRTATETMVASAKRVIDRVSIVLIKWWLIPERVVFVDVVWRVVCDRLQCVKAVLCAFSK